MRAAPNSGKRSTNLTGNAVDNLIKELRDERGWSMADLAARMNTSVSSINRLEKGEKEMSVAELIRLAEIFKVGLGEIVPALAAAGPEPTRGFDEDARPYTADSAFGPLPLPDTRLAWTVTTDSLDAIGIGPGDTIIVDISEEAVRNAGTGDAVVVQSYGPDMTAKTLLRQFIEPDLLITNSRTHNGPPLDRRIDDVVIKGVIISRMETVRRRT